ncbi:hypothetical protein [Microcoleus sp. S13_C5]|uniref:hypothetical protein n=1 Tax=Microcoleus sp. S13_C5 TaxID=3055411 RepID=UPI002FD56F61
MALTIGCDGHHLLSALYDPLSPEWLRQLKAVEILRCVWIQQYRWWGGKVYWGSADDLPPHKQLITSPYDIEARNRTKRDTNWTGYTVHLTETCDRDAPHLITKRLLANSPRALPLTSGMQHLGSLLVVNSYMLN